MMNNSTSFQEALDLLVHAFCKLASHACTVKAPFVEQLICTRNICDFKKWQTL